MAVSGGLEVASDRLLELMKKGVTVEQVARVTRAFTDAGIMVHAYLMYGFPTETEQDTIDALERVRQLFAAGCIQSALLASLRGDGAFARSACTRTPTASSCCPPPDIAFAHNDVEFDDPVGHGSRLSRRGTAQGALQLHARRGARCGRAEWFETVAVSVRSGRGARRRRPRGARASVPATTVPPDLIEEYLG